MWICLKEKATYLVAKGGYVAFLKIIPGELTLFSNVFNDK